MTNSSISLLAEYTSPQTEALLDHLGDLARTGELVGVAFIGIERGRRYAIGWAGAVDSHPVDAIAMVQFLSDALKEHAKEIGYRP